MNIPAALRSLIPNEAQSRYFRWDKQAGLILRNLSYPMPLADRAGLISELADLEQDMADLHLAAFGPDPIEWEDGRDLSESHANSARLCRIVSDAYYEAAFGEMDDDGLAESRDGMDAEQLAAIAALTNASTGPGRASALDGWLYAVFVNEAGGQAGEVLISLAMAERKAAEPGRREYRPRAFPRFRAVRRVWHRVMPFAVVPVIGAVAFTVAGLLLNATGPGTGWTVLALIAAGAVFAAFLPLTEATPLEGSDA